MLSILIPVYNFDIRKLVIDLSGQCKQSGIDFELLCFDDGSTEDFKALNREVGLLPNVTYREMPQNLGRSAIRNALGDAAKFPYLLFMDCDSKVVQPNYIQNYLDHFAPGQLVYGGRCYAPQMPEDERLRFHWKYGSQREVQSPEQRKRAPWHSFMTNNFLIPRDVFLQIKFDESLKQYGHEDTLFGLEVAHRKVPIIHIDAPLEHIGLETAEVFLKKTRQGLENLHILWKRGTPIDTKLLRAFLKIKSLRLMGLFRLAFAAGKPVLEANLRSVRPSLRLFDFYKLGYLAYLNSKNRNSVPSFEAANQASH